MAQEIFRLRPIERELLEIMADGKPHSKFELMKVCNPGSKSFGIKNYMSRIRKVLRPKGQDILCVIIYRRRFYQQVRLLASANDGKK